jgi:DNA-binding IclR family transcriptional regulator
MIWHVSFSATLHSLLAIMQHRGYIETMELYYQITARFMNMKRDLDGK